MSALASPGHQHSRQIPDRLAVPRVDWPPSRLIGLLLGSVLVSLLVLGILHGLTARTNRPPSYLPSLESSYAREAEFDPVPIDDLQRLQADYVFIGDSMLGTRIIPERLAADTDGKTIGLLMQAGTGTAWWYLALKNWVIASGTHPRAVFIFFRDENLTDPLFRATGTFRWTLDRVARLHEPVLDATLAFHTTGAWYRVHRTLEDHLALAQTSLWAEERLRRLPIRWLLERPSNAPEFEERVNAEFGLDRLRSYKDADLATADDERLDFNREVQRSLLPAMLDVAGSAGVRLCFVRIQCRPNPDGPPPQTPAMQRYLADLRAYLASRAVCFHDDTGEPELTLSTYEDGNHVAGEFRDAYTDYFARTVIPLVP